MATQSKSSKSNGSAPTTKAAQKNQARTVAESAVDLPVGAVLVATERISELVEPFTGRTAAEKQFKSYRTQLRRQVKRTERRGATARRRATTEVRKTRSRVEQRVRKAAELLPV
jgi:hypothetical protein